MFRKDSVQIRPGILPRLSGYTSGVYEMHSERCPVFLKKPGALRVMWPIPLRWMVCAGFILLSLAIALQVNTVRPVYMMLNIPCSTMACVSCSSLVIVHAHGFAFRLVVGVGQNDYDCDRQETPSFSRAPAVYRNLTPH